jgi:hypothetical protein
MYYIRCKVFWNNPSFWSIKGPIEIANVLFGRKTHRFWEPKEAKFKRCFGFFNYILHMLQILTMFTTKEPCIANELKFLIASSSLYIMLIIVVEEHICCVCICM